MWKKFCTSFLFLIFYTPFNDMGNQKKGTDMFDKMADKFCDFLWEHDWARRLFIVMLVVLAGGTDVLTFYITFTQWSTNPLAVFVIWAHRFLVIQNNKKNGYDVSVFNELRIYW